MVVICKWPQYRLFQPIFCLFFSLLENSCLSKSLGPSTIWPNQKTIELPLHGVIRFACPGLTLEHFTGILKDSSKGLGSIKYYPIEN